MITLILPLAADCDDVYEAYIIESFNFLSSEKITKAVISCTVYSPIPQDSSACEHEYITGSGYLVETGCDNINRIIKTAFVRLSEKYGFTIDHISCTHFWTESSEGFVRITIVDLQGDGSRFLSDNFGKNINCALKFKPSDNIVLI